MMNVHRSLLSALPLLLILGIGLVGMGCNTSTGKEAPVAKELVVYKTPTCGCCAKWVTHMEAAGFEVTVHDRDNLAEVKQSAGIHPNLQSCHTAFAGDYVIEGHVPATFVEKLLAEKPDIAGIAVPGMPIGSPGMEGPNPVPYEVIAFDDQNQGYIFGRVTP